MSWHAGQLPGLLWNEQKSGFWKPEISTPGKLITEALALINPRPPPNRYTTPVLRYGAIKKSVLPLECYSARYSGEKVLAEKSKTAESRQQDPEAGVQAWPFFFCTHSNVVNSHPNGSVVIDLFCGDRLGLVSQEYAQQQQQTLVAVDHTYRKRETVREGR